MAGMSTNLGRSLLLTRGDDFAVDFAGCNGRSGTGRAPSGIDAPPWQRLVLRRAVDRAGAVLGQVASSC